MIRASIAKQKIMDYNEMTLNLLNIKYKDFFNDLDNKIFDNSSNGICFLVIDNPESNFQNKIEDYSKFVTCMTYLGYIVTYENHNLRIRW